MWSQQPLKYRKVLPSRFYTVILTFEYKKTTTRQSLKQDKKNVDKTEKKTKVKQR